MTETLWATRFASALGELSPLTISAISSSINWGRGECFGNHLVPRIVVFEGQQSAQDRGTEPLIHRTKPSSLVVKKVDCGTSLPRVTIGFSFVDLVEGLHDGQFYALKRILCHEQQDQEEAQREADMHRLFHHPNILRLVAYCLRERGTKHEAWLLLPFFKRGTLWNEIEKLKDKGNFLTEEQIIWLLLGICRGLEAIHAKGYAHRDLKPTNILLGDEGQPVLMDLGSMNQACIHVEGSRQALALQDWAAQRCTISYRAPELFSVQSHCVIDERTDVWSLGCVLYAMMFGEGPYDMVFQKGDSVALAVQNQLSIPQSPRHSSALRQLLTSMMTVDPQQRPHIPLLLSQLEVLQPPAWDEHTTHI